MLRVPNGITERGGLWSLEVESGCRLLLQNHRCQLSQLGAFDAVTAVIALEANSVNTFLDFRSGFCRMRTNMAEIFGWSFRELLCWNIAQLVALANCKPRLPWSSLTKDISSSFCLSIAFGSRMWRYMLQFLHSADCFMSS